MTTTRDFGTLAALFSATALLACGAGPDESIDDDIAIAELEVGGVSPDCDPDALTGNDKKKCETARRNEARRLFKHETFGGNGRTCGTCHAPSTGTLNPDQVADLLSDDPNDPLFAWDGLDDFTSGTSRIEGFATILVERDLPAHISIKGDPSATSVVIERGILSTINAAVDADFMWDMRDRTLQQQAAGAIAGHAQPTETPTANELDLLAEIQQSSKQFFSSQEMYDFAQGGPDPGLPAGNTAAEQRGREFFVDAGWNPPSTKGVCSLCHSGPNLNVSTVSSSAAIGNPPGWTVFDTQVNLANRRNLPTETYEIEDQCGTVFEVTSPDLGVAYTDVYNVPTLAQFLPPPFLCILHPAFFANMFKTPTLRGISKTAPYFHDNSAATLRDAVEHYNFLFEVDPSPLGQGGLHLSEGDIDDIVAYLNLL